MPKTTLVNRRSSWPRWQPMAGASAVFALCCLPTAIPAESVMPEPTPHFEPPALPARLHFPTIVIRRDPFVGSLETAADATAAMPGAGDPSDLVLPPNAAVAAPVLRAVILGPAPKALIEVRGRSIVAGIGTPVADSTVVAIEANAVLLQDGEWLRMTEKRP